ncbi:hypothetical protein B0H17DRAFT_1127341 [Mycena rosella]|uniref:Uncharacterized protein n=1 Tax=Mycena rosella TaxID=1033263 RepID=A0AAD7GRN8_MYCRO|nr:hypothetical protein B0H17DRAFT_1127341 [Mycena rosella]
MRTLKNFRKARFNAGIQLNKKSLRDGANGEGPSRTGNPSLTPNYDYVEEIEAGVLIMGHPNPMKKKLQQFWMAGARVERVIRILLIRIPDGVPVCAARAHLSWPVSDLDRMQTFRSPTSGTCKENSARSWATAGARVERASRSEIGKDAWFAGAHVFNGGAPSRTGGPAQRCILLVKMSVPRDCGVFGGVKKLRGSLEWRGPESNGESGFRGRHFIYDVPPLSTGTMKKFSCITRARKKKDTVGTGRWRGPQSNGRSAVYSLESEEQWCTGRRDLTPEEGKTREWRGRGPESSGGSGVYIRHTPFTVSRWERFSPLVNTPHKMNTMGLGMAGSRVEREIRILSRVLILYGVPILNAGGAHPADATPLGGRLLTNAPHKNEYCEERAMAGSRVEWGIRSLHTTYTVYGVPVHTVGGIVGTFRFLIVGHPVRQNTSWGFSMTGARFEREIRIQLDLNFLWCTASWGIAPHKKNIVRTWPMAGARVERASRSEIRKGKNECFTGGRLFTSAPLKRNIVRVGLSRGAEFCLDWLGGRLLTNAPHKKEYSEEWAMAGSRVEREIRIVQHERHAIRLSGAHRALSRLPWYLSKWGRLRKFTRVSISDLCAIQWRKKLPQSLRIAGARVEREIHVDRLSRPKYSSPAGSRGMSGERSNYSATPALQLTYLNGEFVMSSILRTDKKWTEETWPGPESNGWRL